MSSDDDLDEDELLQMALKEQSQRNVNYQKPASSKSKPVRNYVQPPASRGGRSAGAAAQKKGASKQKKQAVYEDDDSEVEMLSISSGDEDDRGVAAKGRGRKGEDKAWDGGEPSCWKHVDEAEVLCF